MLKTKFIKTKIPQKNEKLRIFKTKKTNQVTVDAIWLVQKKALSTALSFTYLSWL